MNRPDFQRHINLKYIRYCSKDFSNVKDKVEMVSITECTVMNTPEMHQIGYHRLDHGEITKRKVPP